MNVPYNKLLNREDTVYCLKDPEWWALMQRLKLQCGGTWKGIAQDARLSTRHVRKIRHRGKVVSQPVMDKIVSRLGHPQVLEQLEWYTPEQLVEMGVWKPHNTSGLKRNPKKNRTSS